MQNFVKLSFIIIALACGDLFASDFYVQKEIPDFTEKEKIIIDAYQLTFKKLTKKTSVKKHNQNVAIIIKNKGEKWKSTLYDKLVLLENNHADFIKYLFSNAGFSNGRDYLSFGYHANGMIAVRTKTIDKGSGGGLINRSVTKDFWGKDGLFIDREKYGVKGSGCCFIGTTKVTLANDLLKPISELQVGDTILGYDEIKGVLTKTVVEEITIAIHDNLVRLNFEDRSIIATNDHPFYLANGEWVSLFPEQTNLYLNITQTKPMKIGDDFQLLLDGNINNLKLLSIEPLDGEYKTYTINRLNKGQIFFANAVMVGVEKIR